MWCHEMRLVSEEELHQRLCSESVLLIRREDVLQRLTSDCGLSRLHADPRWKALDVEGEAVAPASPPAEQRARPHVFSLFRSGETNGPGRGAGTGQVNTRHHPCSLQLRHHSLRPATHTVRSGACQRS